VRSNIVIVLCGNNGLKWENMKVSVITVVYNNIETISDAIDSVLQQEYDNIEYIIIDGKSNDGTVEIISRYGDKIDIFISEKDDGIYDAINKGIRLANGDIIGLLHSDDIFTDENVISRVVEPFFDLGIDSIYSDLVYVDKHDQNKIIRKWISGNYNRNKFIYGWMPPHPTFFVKRILFERYGYYDTSFGSAADYELILRFMYKYGITTYYIPKILVKMRIGGKSNSNFKNRLIANGQDYRAWQKNDLNPRFYTRYLKPLQKISQYIGN